MGRGRVLAFAMALAVIACGCFAARAGAFVYWSDQGGSIGRANLDGTGVNDTFITAGETGAAFTFGIAVDGQHIYWDDSSADSSIGRANLDGSDPDDSFITLATRTDPEGVAVDGQHIYWDNTNLDTIGRANLDGTGVENSFIPSSATSSPDALAVDGQYIYWANMNGDTIGRANLDGSDPDESFITDSDSPGPTGLAVDGQHIYWSSRTAGAIFRANLDGTDPVDIAENQSFPLGVAVDGQHVYWANMNGGTIGRENLSGVVIPFSSFITGASGPTAVAVDALPLAPSASITAPVSGATFTVGQVVDSTFTCSEGEAGPGISSCLDQNGNGSGAAIDTTTPGLHSLTVTATSADGQTATASSTYTVLAPPVLGPPVVGPPVVGPPVVAPVLGDLKGSRARWREGNAPTQIASHNTHGRPRVGTTFTFTLNTPATVRLVFTTTSSGRLAKIKRKHVCAAQTKHNAKLRKCTRTLAAGTVSLNAHSGTNEIVFQGRLSPTRKLKPGTYTVTITATNATGSFKPRSLKFTIVK
jgi:virginiamycin B lyase